MIAVLNEHEVNRMVLGKKLIKALSWWGERVDFDSILKRDKETNDILIKEADLLRLIQLVNPTQKDRHIRLV